ncbi:MAG: MarR family transcriptional regulator [Alphaproteobacteria bacterium]|nr:MarR family transcriptional regulator [Alphaproteobacteria bacterium]
MTSENYLMTHPLRGAFLAKQLDFLAELISIQGEEMLQDAGIQFPSRAISAALLIGERGSISAADIAEALDQPHQLVSQRIELLIGAGVVSRLPDPEDGRRKTLQLTDKGIEQFERMKGRLAEVERAFQALFEEVGCDLSHYLSRAAEALCQTSLLQRLKSS